MHRHLIAGAFSLLFTASTRTPADAYSDARAPLCSLNPLPVCRAESTTYLVATATPDSIEAGEGLIPPPHGTGHWSAGLSGPVLGQVVRISKLSGFRHDDPAVRRAVEGSGEIVIVPWDYDESCQPRRLIVSAHGVPEPDRTGPGTVGCRMGSGRSGTARPF